MCDVAGLGHWANRRVPGWVGQSKSKSLGPRLNNQKTIEMIVCANQFHDLGN